MCSRPIEELTNLSYQAFLDQKTIASIRKEFKEICQTGLIKKAFTYETIRKDGQLRIHEGVISLKKKNGKVIGFRGTWNDTTERVNTERALADQQRRLEAIFGRVKEGIIALDAKGHITTLLNKNRKEDKV